MGIETFEGEFISLIDQNSCFPTSGSSKIFTTVSTSQKLEINIVEGCRDFHSIGCVNSRIISVENESLIEVKFDIDPVGLLNVIIKNLISEEEEKFSIGKKVIK